MRWALIGAVLGVGLVSDAAAELQRRLTPDGVELQLRFPHAHVRTTVTGRVWAVLGEPGAAVLPDSHAAAVEWLSFLVALPCSECAPEVTSEPMGFHTWEAVELATVSEVFHSIPATPAGALEPSLQLVYLGRWRGIPLGLLRICPWRYEPERKRLQGWTELRIRLRYPEPISSGAQIQPWAPGEKPWGELLLNAEHAPLFRHALEVSYAVQEPFRLERPFVRVSTRRDGIAVVAGSELLQLMPEWRGAPAERLELLWRGRPVPILLRDRNGVLDESDTLFFFGRHPAGDTTWWDADAAEESFFLVLRDSTSGRRFARFEADSAAGEQVSLLPTLLHREQERTYVTGVFEGFYRSWTETAPGEGWYWAILQAGRGVWRDSLQMPASGPVRLVLRGYRLNALAACAPEHRLLVLLNGDTLGLMRWEGWGDIRWEYELPAEKWSGGWNRLQVWSLAADTSSLCSAAQQGIDFVEILGKPKPVALGGEWCGRLATAEQGGQLWLHGFQSATVVVLDTLSGRAAFLEGQPEEVIRVAARSGARPQLEMFLGDSLVVRAEETGSTFLWREPSQRTWQHCWFPAEQVAEMRQFLQQLPSGSELVGASLGEVPETVRALLRQWGVGREFGMSAGAWVWALQVGDTASVRAEKAAEGNWAHLLWVRPGQGERYVVAIPLLARDTAFLWAADSRRWEWARLERGEPPRLLESTPQADVIVIAPPALYGVASRWAQYRRQTHGVSTRVVSTRDIAVTFGFGRLTPHAIKAFLRYAVARWEPPAPQFLLLLGSANWDARNVLGYPKPNLVPSYGVPPSDYWYTLLDGDDYVPELFVGRIPAADSSEAAAFLDKLQTWEGAADELWRKRALLLFGYGFTDTMDTYYSWLTQQLGMEPRVIQKTTPEPSSSRYGPQIRQFLEEGVGVTTYFGHGAEANMELQGWEPQRLSNTERQGILLTLSCSMGNFAVPYVRSFNEQYVMLPRRGMVSALGMSGIGWDIVERTVKHYFVQTLVEKPLRLLGPLYAAARLPLVPFVGQDIYRETVLQHTLLGDPLLRFPVDTVPELFLLSGTPFLHRGDGTPGSEFTVGESVRVRLVIGNLGRVPQRSWRVRLVHESVALRDTLWLMLGAVRSSLAVDTLLPGAWCTVGEHRLWIELNPDRRIPERTWENNGGQLSYRIRQRQLLPLEPLPFWHVQPGRARLRVLNPLGAASDFLYEAELWRGEQLLERVTDTTLTSFDECVDWEPASLLEAGTGYRFRIRARAMRESFWTQWLEVPFWVDSTPTLRWVRWRQAGEGLAAATLWNMEPGVRGVRLSQWRRQLEVVSDPIRSRALIRVEGEPVLELEQEAGIGAAILSPRDTTVRVRFYRTGRTGQSEDAGYFLSLLRDSVQSGQYLVWVVSGEGFWRFSAAQLDTLRQLLRALYGSRLADSLGRSAVAFAFIGAWGREAGSPVEGFRRGDSLHIAAELARPVEKGHVVTAWIGPAQRLGRLILELSPLQQWTLAVYGRRSLEDPATDLLWLGRGESMHDLSAERYAYIQLELEATAPDSVGAPLPELAGITLEFEPQGELALTPRSFVAVPPVLLGDTLPVRLRLWNRALRAEATAVGLRLRTRAADGVHERAFATFPTVVLAPNDSGELRLSLPTAGWLREGILWSSASAAGELYTFNNEAEIPYRLGVDTLPPQLQLWWQEGDSAVLLDSGMAVSRQPLFWLLLSDTGTEAPLSSAAALRAWLEGTPVDSTTAVEYRFYSSLELDSVPPFLRIPRLRAALRFRPPRLPLGSVLVWAVGEDAAGLRDTLSVLLRVTDRLALRLLQHYPVPARRGQELTVRFAYEGYRLQGRARAEVFSLLGERLWTEELPIEAGENLWRWYARHQTGQSLGPGVYLWRIWLPEMGPDAGISGLFVLLP